MKYAAVYDDENMIATSFYGTEEEAVQELVEQAQETWEDLQNSHSIQGFTDKEIDDIARQPDV